MSEESDRKEAAAIRRRWITLGEALAVIAVLISALTLWNSYKERSNGEAERAADKTEAGAKAETLLLRATADKDGKTLRLAPADTDQVIQSQTLVFPSATGAAKVETVADARIEADWIRDAAKAAAKGKGGSGDRRLPVAITTRFVRDGAAHADTAIYDIGYAAEGGFLGGTAIRLRGLSLVRRMRGDNAQAQLDALWKARK